MSTTMTTARKVRPGSLVLWVVQAVLAVAFVLAAVPKLTGEPALVALFDSIGAGQWLRYFVGGCEIAGAIGLLIPRLSGLAALGLAALLVGAVATHLFLGVSPAVPAVYLLIAAVVAWFRRASVRELIRR